VFLAQKILRAHEDVKTVSADESDDGHENQTAKPSAVVKRFMHSENSRSQTPFQQMSESFRVSGKKIS
jgi:hypothetical protein